MASFLQADLPSDDEADEDFNPEEGNSQASRDVEDAKAGRLGLGKKGESAHGKAARRERVDALWQQLNAGNGKKAKLDGATAKVQPDTARPSPPVSVAPTPCPVAAPVCAPPTSAAAGATDDAKERRRSLAAAAIAAARAAAAASASQLYGEERVIETRRFAGKDVTVSRSVPSGGAVASTSGAAGHAAPEKKGGLDAMLASLAGPKKVNVLDKTRSDWTEFKAGDEAIDAELEAHKRSGSQYLEKQAFLQEADVRQYEAERDLRMRGR
ncbi:hypothetical protein ACKKBG_A18520 [Auxenochlorella protothecoides x Auxenochlorella symbiontica]